MSEFLPAAGQGPSPGAIPEAGAGLGGLRAAALVATLTLAVLSYQLNATMITPVLPQIAADLRVGLDRVSGVSSLFFLSGGIAGIVLARWSDFIGRKLCLMIVMSVLVVGTVLCIVAPNLPMLLAGRVMQGCSSAAFQITYLLLREMLRQDLFGLSLGVITAFMGGAGGIDGYLGGLLAGRFGVRSVFAAILCVGLLAIAAAALHLPRDEPVDKDSRMDWAGAAILSVFLACASFFVSDGASAGWTSPGTLAWLGGAALAALVFWQAESRCTVPLVAPLHLATRRFWPILATTTLTLAGIFAVINFTVVLLSQDARHGFGLDSATAALRYLSPAAFIGVLTAPLAGWLADRVGWILVMRIGLGASIVLLAAIALHPSDPLFVMAAVALLGLTYNGLTLTTLNGLGVLLSPGEAPAALPGLNGASFGLGANLGIAVVAPFAAAGSALGYVTALAISCAITVAAFAASLFIAHKDGEPA